MNGSEPSKEGSYIVIGGLIVMFVLMTIVVTIMMLTEAPLMLVSIITFGIVSYYTGKKVLNHNYDRPQTRKEDEWEHVLRTLLDTLTKEEKHDEERSN